MPNLNEIQQSLRKQKPYLAENYGVRVVGIFGSYVRGEETQESDVDILIDFSEPIGWEFLDIKDILEEAIEKEMDIVTVGALKPRLKDIILEEVVYI